MRLILEIQLNNGTIMNVIADAQNKEDAKKWAVQSSNRLFGDSNMHVHNDNKIISVDKWSQEKQTAYKRGNTEYIVTFFMDNITQFLKVEAAGIKSAYNSVKVKYGISDNLNMMIYEVNQSIKNKQDKKQEVTEEKRKSAVSLSKELMKDSGKLSQVLVRANEKAKSIPILNIYESEIFTMFSLVTDYCSGKYGYTTLNTILGILSCTLYFLSPNEVIADITPEIQELDAITTFAWAIKQSKDEITHYNDWIDYNKSLLNMG